MCSEKWRSVIAFRTDIVLDDLYTKAVKFGSRDNAFLFIT